MKPGILKLCVALLASTCALPKLQAFTDDELIAELDLARPGLEAVATSIAKGDQMAAKHALAEYYRHRTKPLYYIGLGEKANPKPTHPDLERAERAIKHQFESIGYPHTFGPVIDWRFDKTAEPGSKYAPNSVSFMPRP